MEGARLYLEAEIDKDNSNMREVKIHFCDFIRIMIKNFSRKASFLYLFISNSYCIHHNVTNLN